MFAAICNVLLHNNLKLCVQRFIPFLQWRIVDMFIIFDDSINNDAYVNRSGLLPPIKFCTVGPTIFWCKQL